MIGRLRGRLVECAPTRAIVDVGGVGYELHVPLSTFYAISGDAGCEVQLHVHMHVREDALQLFGFATREERGMFELLIGISGVGPRMAVGILSGIGVADLRQAVLSGDRERLQKVPGVGRKTAERVMLELRDRLPAVEEGAAAPAGGATTPTGDGGLVDDAVSALVNLGYARDVARRAAAEASEAPDGDDSLERVLRRALRILAR